MNYREEYAPTKQNKENYINELWALVNKRNKDAITDRDIYIKDIFTNTEKYREDFKHMLGWPLVDYEKNGIPKAESEKITEDNEYEVFRMKIEILDGLNMTGLFFRAKGEGKKPLVIVQHGGDGTPESISGFYGDTSNYNDMLQRVKNHGVHMFAPQLLLWQEEWYGVERDRKGLDAQLKRTGSSIAAIEVFGITRILDYFEAQDFTSSFGMVGLSYGGFYTLFTTAVDTRIKSAVSCAFFNSRDVINWSDWTWQDAAFMFDDAEVACLSYPRHMSVLIADKDALFDVKYGIRSFERLKELSKDVGTDWFDFLVFDGCHEFYKGDEHIERLIEDLK